GESLRLFVMDSEQLFKEDEEEKDPKEKKKYTGEPLKQVFINPVILKEYGKKWVFEEGCLSIPGIRENVEREDTVVVRFYDQDFKLHEKEYTGITARIIQHE